MSGSAEGLPGYVQARIGKWDEIAARRAEENKNRVAQEIKITMPDGKVIEGKAWETSPMDIASGISSSLAQQCMVAKVNGALWDMTRPLEADCDLLLCKFSDPDGEYTFWHSSAHVLGEALEAKYENARLCIGPPIEDGGFYYDVFLGEGKVVPDHFAAVETIVKKIVKEKQAFTRLTLSKQEALHLFSDNQFKLRLINDKIGDNDTCSAYRCGPFVDLCRGPHVPNTGKIKFLNVTKSSSAYWLGKNTNESLQRVYGISFPDKKLMKQYKLMIKEAAERDHRKIGSEQKLFFFNDISPGSCFFLPHGTRIYNRLVSFIRGEYVKRGYEEVVTPNVYNLDLWKTSGHYANYKDNMFTFKSENVEFGMKPMNCPGHCVMFKHQLHSYRELPIRMADFGVLHRNELSGALTGLTRVRRFQQDDAHIFCRIDQIEAEIGGVLNFLKFVYDILGFTYTLQLSTRPLEKYLGEIATWDAAELALANCLTENKMPWGINPNDGAFYGPKIDIQLKDALGRRHQCATIQLDFQLPERFGLSFTNNSNEKERPVMVHRAILGSVERMIAVLCEHTGGRWPFWLSPRQIQIIPVDLKWIDYSRQVYNTLKDAGFYVDIDDSKDQLKKKIRNSAKLYNCCLILGPQEVENNTVNVRRRETPLEHSEISLADFVADCKNRVDTYQ